MGKHMVIDQVKSTSFIIVDAETASHRPPLNDWQRIGTINIVSTNVSHGPPQEVKRDEAVRGDWLDSMNNLEEYCEYRRAFLKMFKQFETFWMEI